MTISFKDMTEPEITGYMNHLAGLIESLMPAEANPTGRCMFALIIFDQPGMLRMVTNGRRDEVWRALRESNTPI